MSEEKSPNSPEHPIVPRQMSFEFSADTPRYWMGGDPFETAILNALSMTFPAGEKFFMDSVRHYRDQIEDPALKRDVRAFLSQEALHSREHDALNKFLDVHGVDHERYHASTERALNHARALIPKINQLGVTCALEHFTAILAAGFLTDKHYRELAHPNIQPLWIWHAIEELEHKAVAYDVYRAVGGSYFTRITTMLFTTFFFLTRVSAYVTLMMIRDGSFWNLRSWARGLWRTWGPRGFFTRLIPAYLDYYRPGFHPWQRDDHELVEHWARVLAKLVPYTELPQSGANGASEATGSAGASDVALAGGLA